MKRLFKYPIAAMLIAAVGGYAIFGTDAGSYLRTTSRSVQQMVKQSVPLEFELRRARDMIDTILPDLQSQVRVIAQEEVEIASLKSEVSRDQSLARRNRNSLKSMRDQLRTQQVSFKTGARELSRQQLTEQLDQRLRRYQQAQVSLASKQKLLQKREDSLAAALEMLDRMRDRKAWLEQKVETLAAQNRLLKASQVQAGKLIDSSQLSGADQLLTEIEKRLAVAQRVLAYEEVEPQADDRPFAVEEEVLSTYDDLFGETELAETTRDDT